MRSSLRRTAAALTLAALTFALAPARAADVAPPQSLLTSVPGSPRIRPPIDGLGAFEGDTIDEESSLVSLRVEVLNPLGMSKTYEVRALGSTYSSPSNGFVILSNSDGGKAWTWRWISPSLDPHLVVPGRYVVVFLGIDASGNREGPVGGRNTAEVVLL